ncbi:MAG: hypothetical protein [Microviridae sp.]|nr:MAG: hypothetical protein [Microviridae sp.]
MRSLELVRALCLCLRVFVLVFIMTRRSCWPFSVMRVIRQRPSSLGLWTIRRPRGRPLKRRRPRSVPRALPSCARVLWRLLAPSSTVFLLL